MRHELTLLLILPLLWYQSGSSNSNTPTPYEVADAYEVYATVLPSEWPLRDAHAKALVIQAETKGFEMCLRPDKEWEQKVGPAISDYVRMNAKPFLLQRRLNIKTPYQLVLADQLSSAIHAFDWEGFYQQYPDSGGWLEVSAVGFNNDKTVAVVYMGHHCGSLCGGGGFHVLEKKDGKWVLLDWKGSSCAWAA
jgi:hypothetical protein